MLLATAFTPIVNRKSRPQGRLTYTYAEDNALQDQNIAPQQAPDPIRQGDTFSRPARRYVALMETDTANFGSGMQEDFLPYNRTWIPRFIRAGMERQLNIRAQQSAGNRMNIARGQAVAYGSLFELQPPSATI